MPHLSDAAKKRRELHILRVANGWMIQPIGVAAALDPSTGQPWPQNTPDEIAVAADKDTLMEVISEWLGADSTPDAESRAAFLSLAHYEALHRERAAPGADYPLHNYSMQD